MEEFTPMKIALPEHVKEIIQQFNINGFEAYAVGGCIRDAVLGLTPHDWDITTSALPEQIKTIFRRTLDTGLKHGTVTVMIQQEAYEITTYRIDGDYSDGRRPNSVSFTSDLVEDLKRRDFTINAMAYNEKDGLVDVFNGKEDIENQIIRCVGSAEERFEEDALRMLRAIRFSARLGFSIVAETEAAILKNAELIKKISAERIHDELTKILISKNPHYIERVVNLGMMRYIIPEFMINVGLKQINRHHMYTVDQHTYVTLLNIEDKESLRWTMFLHDIGKGICASTDEMGISHYYGHPEKGADLAKNILLRLHFDNKTKDEVIRLILNHDYRIEPKANLVRKAINHIGIDLFGEYLKVCRADVMAQNINTIPEKLENLALVEKLFQDILISNQCTTLKDLKINGRDLVQLGVREGKIIGSILSQLLDAVLEDQRVNEREELLNRATEMAKQFQS